MQPVMLKDEVHALVKSFCVIKGIKIQDFVNDTLKNNPKLKDFNSKVKKIIKL